MMLLPTGLVSLPGLVMGKSRLLLAGASTPFGVRKSSMPESISVPTMGSHCGR